MTSDRTQFQHINLVQTPIHIVNCVTMMAEGEGDVLLNLTVKDVKNPVILKKVLYVPEMGSSGLVSVRFIQAAGVVFSLPRILLVSGMGKSIVASPRSSRTPISSRPRTLKPRQLRLQPSMEHSTIGIVV